MSFVQHEIRERTDGEPPIGSTIPEIVASLNVGDHVTATFYNPNDPAVPGPFTIIGVLHELMGHPDVLWVGRNIVSLPGRDPVTILISLTVNSRVQA